MLTPFFGSDPFLRDSLNALRRFERNVCRPLDPFAHFGRRSIFDDPFGFDDELAVFDRPLSWFDRQLSLLNRPAMFDELAQRMIQSDPEHTSYYRKEYINDNGHVKTKTIEKEPGKDWEVKEKEYDLKDKMAVEDDKSGNKQEALKDQSQEAIKDSNTENKDNNQVSEIKESKKSLFGLPSWFDRPSWFERPLSLLNKIEELPERMIQEDPEHAHYYKKEYINDNGHVKVKIMEKEPGKEWVVKEKEYAVKDRKAIKEGKTQEAIKDSTSEKMSATNSLQKSMTNGSAQASPQK
jgi:hypothetical protein